MGSVDALAKWLNEKPRENGAATVVQQVRLHPDTARALAYLSRRFGMPKATLAAELLGAAIKDALDATPGDYTLDQLACMGDRSAICAIEEGADPGMRVHYFSGVSPDDGEDE